jgi:hypothetical protein
MEANIHASKVEAVLSPTAIYEDEGAICSDYHDGIIPDVKISGDTVDMNKARDEPYNIIYTCTNSFGGVQTAGREVYVRDTTCPVCVLKGAAVQTIEASFPYQDPGSTCTDNYSNVTQHATSSVNVERMGTYHITYTGVDQAGNSNTDCGASPLVRTVITVDTLKPVIGLRYNDMYLTKTSLMTEERAQSSTLIWSFTLAGCAMAMAAALAITFSSKKTGRQQHSTMYNIV